MVKKCTENSNAANAFWPEQTKVWSFTELCYSWLRTRCGRNSLYININVFTFCWTTRVDSCVHFSSSVFPRTVLAGSGIELHEASIVNLSVFTRISFFWYLHHQGLLQSSSAPVYFVPRLCPWWTEDQWRHCQTYLRKTLYLGSNPFSVSGPVFRGTK